MARRKADDDTTESNNSTHEHWNNIAPHRTAKGEEQTYAEAAGALKKGRCRCTSIEHQAGEPGCESAPEPKS